MRHVITSYSIHYTKLYDSTAVAAQVAVVPSSLKLTILFGSHTGRSEGIAKKLSGLLEEKSISTTVVAMDDYNPKQLETEENVLIVVSTHGEGEPPEMAEDFHRFRITSYNVCYTKLLRYREERSRATTVGVITILTTIEISLIEFSTSI